MIAVLLQGGLGNQMFQYAAGLGLAEARGAKLLLATHALAKRRNQTHWPYELGAFHLSASVCDSKQEREIARATRLKVFARFLTRWNVHAERGTAFDPTVLEAPDGTLLRGYWQSERYFRHCRQAVASQLTATEALSPVHDVLRRRMLDGASVSVHVRRGDYVTLASAANFHGVLPLAYYKSAIERIRQVEARPVFYVFSDDPAWCKANLAFDGCETHHVSAELASTGVQDLTLMRSCRHHIIANSSFSWWGAWLAGCDRANGVAIAPRRWFALARDEAGGEDRIPPGWELL